MSELWALVEKRMGVCPSFFKLAQHDPGIAWGLFRLAEFAYLDSDMPSLFKELLFTYLSRFCEVRYCILRHAAFLMGRGFISGDPECAPLSAEKVAALLEEPLPREDALPGFLEKLEETGAPIDDWPEFDSELGFRFRVACAMIFINPAGSTAWVNALKRLLGAQRHERLMLFLAFVRTAHFWTHVHPELQPEPDVEAILSEHKALASLLLHEKDSGRWKLREALRESEERYRQLMQALPTAMYMCDAQGRLRLYNDAAEALWGRKAELGKDCWCGSWRAYKADGSPLPLDEAPMVVALRERRELRGPEVIIERPDGTRRHVLPHIRPFFDADGNLTEAVNLLVDVTERRQAEEVVREADRRKTEFLALLAHELRNPLAPIRNAVHVLRQVEGSAAIQTTTDMLERQVGHMVRLVDDLLDVSRISHGRIELRKERVGLAAIVEQAVEAARPTCAAAGHELTVSLPSQTIELVADPARIAQILGNLLSNACKFTPKGGHLRLSAEREDSYAVIRVQDDGVGIAEDELPHVFEMFRQVDNSLERSRSGLGIGLTLVKTLVNMHEGTVEARSAGTGQGSEFVVRLKLLRSPTAAAPEPTKGVGPSTTRRRILIVDDNMDSAASLGTLLGLLGHEVHIAQDGVEAVEQTAKLRPDVVLLDIGLPKLNGYEAARRIREKLVQEGRQRPILIALTGWGQEEDRRRSEESGFDAHMVKPVDPAALGKLLSELG